MTNAYNDTTEESESDVGEGIVLRRRNAFGEPKTSRHNRPPRPKKLLEKREKIAMHKSKRILEMHAAKKEGKYKYSREMFIIHYNIFDLFSIRYNYSPKIFNRNIRKNYRRHI